ncbi:flagellar hook-associated protein FlgL [Alphaproteobacteria bacterium]|nr:flagellar hook-associated protein FlgL [Alphaproteobacteria bacterium]
MRVSNKLFNEQQVRAFQSMRSDMQGIQEKIASGNKINRASDDPMGAVNLSAAREQRTLIEQFSKNSDFANMRLDLSDKTLDEMTTVLTRMTELTATAGNGVYDGFGHQAILNELKQLSEVALGLANTTDSMGRPLFAGRSSVDVPFTRNVDGTVAYNGDRGQHSVQVSESLTTLTGIDGGSAFMRVETPNGRRSVFEVIQSAMNSIETGSQIKGQATGGNKTRLDFTLPSKTETWSFTLSGNTGAAQITAEVARDNLGAMVTEINRFTSQTSVSAAIDAATGDMILTDITEGEIKIEDISISGQDSASEKLTSYVEFTKLDGSLAAIGPTVKLTDRDQLIAYNISSMNAAMDSISAKRSLIASQMSKNGTQKDVLEGRKLVVDRDVSKLNDTDLAEMITKLQGQMTNLEAAQAAFSKIGQQSLFDYLR